MVTRPASVAANKGASYRVWRIKRPQANDGIRRFFAISNRTAPAATLYARKQIFKSHSFSADTLPQCNRCCPDSTRIRATAVNLSDTTVTESRLRVAKRGYALPAGKS